MSGDALPLDREVPALLVRTQRHPLHHGTLAALRSLGRAGVPVHVLSPQPRAAAEVSRYRAGATAWSDGHGLPGEDGALRDRLRAVAARLPRPVAVALDDRAAVLLAVDGWDDVLRTAPVRSGAAAALGDKARLLDLCAAQGVATAATVVVAPGARLPAAGLGLPGPFVVKPAQPWQPPGTPRVRFAPDVRAVQALVDRDAQRGRGVPLVVQQEVPATPGGDLVVMGHLSADGQGDLLATAVKVRASPARAGQASLARSCTDAWGLELLTARLLRSAGHRGPFDTDWRWDPRQGVHVLLDVNPRLGACFRVGTRPDGVDAVRALHLELTGRRLPAGRVPPGRVLRVGPLDVRHGLHALRAGRGPVGGEGAWWAPDDLLPVAALLAQAPGALLRRR